MARPVFKSESIGSYDWLPSLLVSCYLCVNRKKEISTRFDFVGKRQVCHEKRRVSNEILIVLQFCEGHRNVKIENCRMSGPAKKMSFAKEGLFWSRGRKNGASERRRV